MRSIEELKTLMDQARELGVNRIEVDGVAYHLAPKIETNVEATDLEIYEAMNEFPYTEEEILYYATEYFDELQAKKQEKGELNG